MIVRIWMTGDPFTLKPGMRITRAAVEMTRHGVHHAPVVEPRLGPELLGIVTKSDLLRAVPQEITCIPEMPSDEVIVGTVAEIMSHPVITTTPNTPIEHAASMMQLHHIGALPVVEGPRLVGILSRDDVFRAVSCLLRGEGVLRVIFEAPSELDAVDLVLQAARRHGLDLAGCMTTCRDERFTVNMVHLRGHNPGALVTDLQKAGCLVLEASGSVSTATLPPPSGRVPRPRQGSVQ
jgi:acetoin utilization protein AcuB